MSGPGKEDDGDDEARGRDARLLVRRRAVDDAILVGTPTWWRTVAMDVVEDGGDGCGGGQRRWMGWRTEAGVGMVF